MQAIPRDLTFIAKILFHRCFAKPVGYGFTVGKREWLKQFWRCCVHYNSLLV
jgi:hypothetical protein